MKEIAILKYHYDKMCSSNVDEKLEPLQLYICR